jgi:HAD superfamily hydrolase (TIGR01490 family)|tara:strand:+ start:820 stop:1527 length:708 start_codon:yes stop_codon:yes gene_type:complete
MKTVAVFDIDGTLLKGNIYLTIVKYVYLHKIVSKFLHPKTSNYSTHFSDKIKLKTVLKSFQLILFHRLNLPLKFEYLKTHLLGFVQGWTVDKFQNAFQQFFQNHLKSRVFPQMREQVRKHKAEGKTIVFLTTQPTEIAEVVKNDLGADYCISTTLETNNNHYTGNIKDICFGAEKLVLLNKFLKQHSIDLKNSFSYADSFSDIDVLKAVGNPVVVNPDGKLKKFAQKNNWKILNY